MLFSFLERSIERKVLLLEKFTSDCRFLFLILNFFGLRFPM
jgi:hypothetical protein